MDMALMTQLASFSNDGDHDWWPLWPLLWFGLIVTVVWLITRRRWAAERSQTGTDRARDILAERYARGEITSDEYRERLEQLR